jgi:hypothetical protein
MTFKINANTSYRGKRFQVPTRLTTVTHQTGEHKVDLTRHPKFPLALGELASGRFSVMSLLNCNFVHAMV